MKKHGKYILFLCLALSLFLFFGLSVPAFAADDASQLYEESGVSSVFDSLDEETLDLLGQLGVDTRDPEAILHIGPEQVVQAALSVLTGGLADPVRQCMIIMGCVLLFALVDSVSPGGGKASEPSGMLFMLILAFLVIVPVTGCVRHALSAVQTLSGFTKLLLPVLTALAAASGKPLTAAAASAAGLGAAETVSALVDTFFVPVTGAYAAVCLVAAVNPLFNLQNIALFFRRVFTVLLGGVAVLFSGVLTLKGSAASAADSLAFKGVKFLVGGLVPVVGGAVSEGLSSVTAALVSVNKAVGALGILAMVLTVLPTVLEILIWWAALYVCSLAATLAGQPQIAFYLSGVSNVIVMLNILLLFDFFVFLAAVGVVMGFAAG